MSGSDFRIFHNVPWNPVPYLRSPLRESGSPRILFDRSLLLGWSFVAWKTGREWVFPEQGRDFAKDVDQECRTFLKKLVGGGNPHSSLSPPFQQGYVFLVPYETGEMLEPAGTHPLCNRFPLIVVECLEVVAYHHPSRTLFLPPSCPDILQDVSLPETLRERVEPQALFLKPTLTFEHYKEKILCIQERIARGDYFQLNFALSFDASTDCSIDYLSLYHHLASTNPSPGMAFFSRNDVTLVSNSPERLFTLSGNHLVTTPIAGTFPDKGRGKSPDEDFRSDPKERAEHIMTVDLLRNDVGRVCLPGSVHVPRLLAVERYAHLRHLVSDVRGTLKPRTSLWDLLQAFFPGGSVTGAPKIAVRKDIAGLEESPRGYYCGTLGVWDPSGFADFNILIRTLIRYGDSITLPAGSGIVADSQADREYREIQAKARTILENLGTLAWTI
ncbi:MAG: anthranilate synthase component I family protein [Nitrospirae bacterium]|jgi:anthranilate/para-aminobenzoate synthase component I|nr:anthranilate synthase component I family protein [Nitrospirota bacterium]